MADFKKHIEDYKAEALLKANKKNKRLALDLKMMNDKLKELKGENTALKDLIKKIKNSDKITRRMRNADFELYAEGVPMIREEYIDTLKIQLCDLFRRKLELEGKKDTEKNKTLRHYNAIAMGAVLRDIEECEKGGGIIEFDY